LAPFLEDNMKKEIGKYHWIEWDWGRNQEMFRWSAKPNMKLTITESGHWLKGSWRTNMARLQRYFRG
jgi:hypothetical protein